MAGDKDKAEKILEAFNDVFADIINVLIFKGRVVILPEDLEDQAPRSHYKAEGRLRDIERDVVKRWKSGNIRIACIGVENQTKADRNMPLRIIGYDGAEYRAQLLNENKDGDVYPVITLVLYFGYEKRWTTPVTLKERLNIPEGLEEYVSDYRINVFEIAYLTREQVSMFKSDFRFVADYFVQKRETGDYVPSPEAMKHVQATLQLMSIVSGDYRFEEAYNEATDLQKGELKTMCDVLDRIENRGLERGIKQGIEKGRTEGRAEGIKQGELKKAKEMAVSMADMGISIDKIAEAAKVAVDTVRQWIAEAQPQK